MQEYILKTVYHKTETAPLSSEEKERERELILGYSKVVHCHQYYFMY